VKMALSQNANLTVLKLGYNNLGDHGVATLAGGIALHRSLGLLDLGFNNFGDEGAKALSVAMRQAAKASNGGTLHTLYLAGNLIGEDGAVAMADFIRQGSRLQKLYMTGNRIGADGVRAITEAILEDEVLRRGEPRPEDDDTEEDLEVDRNQFKSPPRPKATFEGMQQLFLGGTGMSTMGCNAVSGLLERTSSLRVISLPNCEMGDDEICMLASSIRANKARLPLESIQLSFNNMTHKGLEALTNAVWGSPTLKELKLDNNEIGDRGAHQVAAILPALKALVTLDVGFNAIKAAGLNVLMKAVADTDQIQSLSLSGNAIDVPSAKAVAYALAYNQSLQSIFLVHCSINHEGKRHITAGSVSNCQTSLRNLTGFDIGRKYCESWARPCNVVCFLIQPLALFTFANFPFI
jgi:Ran GTPase-activating protein (RanGAP) involved in mRNA processing and transport